MPSRHVGHADAAPAECCAPVGRAGRGVRGTGNDNVHLTRALVARRVMRQPWLQLAKMSRAQCAKRSPSPGWGERADYNNLFGSARPMVAPKHKKAGARHFCGPQATLQNNRGELRAACERGCVPDRGSCPQPPRHHHDASHYALVTRASVAGVKPKAAKSIRHICCRLTHMCVCRDKKCSHHFSALALTIENWTRRGFCRLKRFPGVLATCPCGVFLPHHI